MVRGKYQAKPRGGGRGAIRGGKGAIRGGKGDGYNQGYNQGFNQGDSGGYEQQPQQDYGAQPNKTRAPWQQDSSSHRDHGPKRTRTTSPDSVGRQKLQDALQLARDVHFKSSSWRLGNVKALEAYSAPEAQTLLEALNIAEVEAISKLVAILETAFVNDARSTQQTLADYRAEMGREATAAPPPPSALLALPSNLMELLANQLFAHLSATKAPSSDG
jgi:hypothetical protein